MTTSVAEPRMLDRKCTLLVLFALSVLHACSRQSASDPEILRIEGRTMGTTYSIKLVRSPDQVVESDALKKEVDEVLERIDGMMSTYRDDSEISRFAQAAVGEAFGVSSETARVIKVAQQIGRLSGGAFDCTVAPLVELWGFGPNRKEVRSVPSAEAIEAARSRTGFDAIEVDLAGPVVRKTAPRTLDLSAIAKGFAVDRVAARLERKGFKRYFIEIGGEVRCRGPRSRGPGAENAMWRVGIEPPKATPERSAYRVIKVGTRSVATSGNYRNFFEVDGVRYSHGIDPRSGYPCRHRLASVTVLADDCMTADAWATALMILGPEEGVKLAEKQKLSALFLIEDDDGIREMTTSAWIAEQSRY